MHSRQRQRERAEQRRRRVRQRDQVGAGREQQLEQEREPRAAVGQPAASAIKMTPMTLVQTKVELPKYGASSRAAHSSIAMIDMPAQKAST
ncbi:MAG TPA: hypothetical protein VLX30_16220 [Burkholderiales bacterium]|nr:hypothetical protein [Burkholderiales bacterium]